MPDDNLDTVRQQLAPNGVLRAALNLSNFLLINTNSNNAEPDGVSPDVARLVADELKVELELISYQGPGHIADAAERGEWDIANIAAEPERARAIAFSPAYCEIQASYLLPPHSTIKTLQEVDQKGHHIAVKERAAYDLWLTANLQHAELHRAESHDATFELFLEQKLDALSGLRPKLIEQQKCLPGSILLEDSFTAVKQSIGCQKGKPEAADYLEDLVSRILASGKIAALIEHHGVTGKLSPAKPWI